jgi:hypothetical protein
MLGTPKALGQAIEGEAVSQAKPAWPEEAKRDGMLGRGKGNYG